MKTTTVLLTSILIITVVVCRAQTDSIFRFKILTRFGGKPISSAFLQVDDFKTGAYTRKSADSNGLLTYNTTKLSSDSGRLIIRVATDTIAAFTIYKYKVYNLEMTLFVDTEAIRKRNEKFRNP